MRGGRGHRSQGVLPGCGTLPRDIWALRLMHVKVQACRASLLTTCSVPPPRSTYEAFLHAAGMVQTRTFRIDGLDVATGARLGGCGAMNLSIPPAVAATSVGAGGDTRSEGRAVSALSADEHALRGSPGSITGSSRAGAASEGDSGETEQERWLVPVIDFANHSTLAAGVNAELRLGAGEGSGLRFALDARESRHTARLQMASEALLATAGRAV